MSMYYKDPTTGSWVKQAGGGGGAYAVDTQNVKYYGAKGDGTTDDTAAFQEALAAKRVVSVPGGTYLLSGGITIGDNCMLELSQDTVLNFTQTSGNCITLGMSSTLKGNHATMNVPYAFTGNALYANSADHTNDEQKLVPPFSHWTPQWKSGRYVTDLNICKAQSNGLHMSVDGTCSGTAVYLSADGTSGYLTYMWGIHFSGLRISGAFSYGVRAVNFNDGWLHEMRVDAFIEACEIGVSLEDCNNAYVSAIIQPVPSDDGSDTHTAYAKHGIQLIRSKNVDLSGSRVWDWMASNTLWTEGGEYQHIALRGNCRGLILNDFFYYEMPGYDIRDLIYTDTESNLEQMTILQEPITRWFKVKDGEPYCYNGIAEKKLITQEELDSHFDTDIVKKFTDVLPAATDGNGAVFNEVGYVKSGCTLIPSTGLESTEDAGYYGCTGFIPVKASDTVYVQGIVIPAAGDGWGSVVLYDASFNRQISLVSSNTAFQDGSAWYFTYTAMDGGFKLVVAPNNDPADAAYLRIGFLSAWVKSTPMIAINEEIKYTAEGFLSDGVKVKGENLVLTGADGKTYKLVVGEGGALSTAEYSE